MSVVSGEGVVFSHGFNCCGLACLTNFYTDPFSDSNINLFEYLKQNKDKSSGVISYMVVLTDDQTKIQWTDPHTKKKTTWLEVLLDCGFKCTTSFRNRGVGNILHVFHYQNSPVCKPYWG